MRTRAEEIWKLVISSSKRNVFFSLSDPLDKVKKLLTPGLIRKKGIRKEFYQKLDDKKSRRKKRNCRMFINNQKRSSPAYLQTWSLMYSYILEQKLLSKQFCLILSGSNLKLSQTIGKKVLRQPNRLRILHVLLKETLPHNGCPLKIKKRKKNKGRNRRRKLLQRYPRPLPGSRNRRLSHISKGFSNQNINRLRRGLTSEAKKISPMNWSTLQRATKNSNVRSFSKLKLKGRQRRAK